MSDTATTNVDQQEHDRLRRVCTAAIEINDNLRRCQTRPDGHAGDHFHREADTGVEYRWSGTARTRSYAGHSDPLRVLVVTMR